MPEDSELRNFFLGYCRLVGGVVDDPAYGITEVLLPDETARHLGVAPYLRLSFEERSTQDSPAKEVVHQPLYLHYGHPLVEGIVEEVRQRAANARLYINAVRLEKARSAGAGWQNPGFSKRPPVRCVERRRGPVHFPLCMFQLQNQPDDG
jgi:hypothetical protein